MKVIYLKAVFKICEKVAFITFGTPYSKPSSWPECFESAGDMWDPETAVSRSQSGEPSYPADACHEVSAGGGSVK